MSKMRDDRAARAAAGAVLWRAELTETVRLAWPMALTQLGQIAMMTTDLVLLGRLGSEVVAATTLAHTVLFAAFVVGMGLIAAVAPLAAQAFGARRPRDVRKALRAGLWAALLAGVPLSFLQLRGEAILLALGQASGPAALAGDYLASLGFSLVPAWCFMALRNFMGAVNRPEPALWITLAAIPANLVLAYALIFGAFGLPRLELFGAGLATALVNLLMCAAAVAVCYAQHPFKKYRILGEFFRPDGETLRQLVVIGLPVTFAYSLEFGLFAVAAIMMGWLGTVELAAHQIALQVASIMFMVPFGISMAATVRVGQAVGRRDAPGTRRAGWVAIALGAAFMTAMVVLVVLTREVIPLVYLGPETPELRPAIALAATLLVLGASFFIADGVQTIAAGALRGFADTRVPLLFAAISFWGVGFPLAHVLGFGAALGAEGIWIGLSVGVMVYAMLLLARFALLTRRRYLPRVVGEMHG